MMLKQWEDLPEKMRISEVRPYYDALKRKKMSLIFKRVFDVFAALMLMILLFPVFLILSVAIKLESRGPVFYRQIRITQYGRKFRIHKLRTMVENADSIGASLTANNDTRITRVGRLIRRTRLDEIPQLIDVLAGNMTFVGTRPEVEKYVECYTPEMLATLLLPAGITSFASIRFKDEDRLLEDSSDVDSTYINEILPKKMSYNLNALKCFSLFSDIKLLIRTAFAVVMKKEDQ